MSRLADASDWWAVHKTRIRHDEEFAERRPPNPGSIGNPRVRDAGHLNADQPEPSPFGTVSYAPPATIAQTAAGKLQAATGLDVVAVAIVEQSSVLSVRGVAGARTGHLNDLTIPSGQGLAGRVLREGSSIVVGDYLTDPRLSGHYGYIAAAEGIGGIVGVPIRDNGRVLGVILGARRNVGPPNAAVYDAVCEFAVELSVGLGHSLRQARTLDAARRRQRQVIADRLSRDVGRRLRLIECAAGELRDSDSPEIAVLAASLAREARRGTRCLGQVTDATEPSEPSNQIEVSLKRLVNDLDRRSDINSFLITLGESRRLLLAVHSALIRFAQEAHLNVEAHAQATRVVTSLVFSPTSVSLAVQNDGNGPIPQRVASIPIGRHSWGLASAEARAERLGGSFHIGPSDDSGTIVRITIPTSGPA